MCLLKEPSHQLPWDLRHIQEKRKALSFAMLASAGYQQDMVCLVWPEFGTKKIKCRAEFYLVRLDGVEKLAPIRIEESLRSHLTADQLG